jgi:hypothetical protein
MDRMPCSIKQVPAPKPAMSFYDFQQFESLLESARADWRAELIVLLGGEAGLRSGEMVALEWQDVDVNKGLVCVQRSAWKGRSRFRRWPASPRTVDATSGCSPSPTSSRTRAARHVSGRRSAADREGGSESHDSSGATSRTAREWPAHSSAHVLLTPGDARRRSQSDPGARGTPIALDHAAIHALESSSH